MVYTLNIKPGEDVNHYYSNHKAAYKGDSGIELFFPEDVVCRPNETNIIDLRISCEMETSTYNNCSYYVYPRSSISKTPLIMHNSVGIIDSGYRNTIKVAVRNVSNTVYIINKGDRLFQICAPDLGIINLKVTEHLSETDRGAGFGSSGK